MQSISIPDAFLTRSRSGTLEAYPPRVYPKENGSSQADFHARIFPSLVKELGWTVADQDYGLSMPASLASYDRATRSWRTSERSLFEDLTPSLDRLPKSGMMRNGKIYALPMSERPTGAKESGLWRTPCATDGTNGGPNARDSKGGLHLTAQVMWPTPQAHDATGARGKNNTFSDHHYKPHDLVTAVMWPTPRANDAEKRGEFDITNPRNGLPAAVHLWPTPRTAGMCGGTGNWNQLKDKCENIEEARKMGAGNGGQLNPTWVEWLMGYPLGWTDLNVSGIALSLKSRN